MNENDANRYFWRTGRRWSGDSRVARTSPRGLRLHGREIFFICIALVFTLAGLILMR
jgi:hypothetical protein